MKLHPLLHSEDLEGGIWVPEDAVAQPQAICKALATLAQAGGKVSIVCVLKILFIFKCFPA